MSSSSAPRHFYGWPLAVVVWLLYGLQVAGYYSWGFYLPEMSEELGISRASGGLVFGVSLFCAGAAAPLVGMAITRFGLRRVMTAGFAVSAFGYLATSRAQSFWQLLVVYGIFTAGTHAFAAVLPTQTVASIWFLRYRARVLAGLLTAGGVAAPFIFWFDAWILQTATWRTGWVVIGILNFVLAIIAYAFVRDSPESLGQLRDGAAAETEVAGPAPSPPPSIDSGFTAREAIRTPQFVLLLICGLGYGLPWGVLGNHSRLHLQDLGFEIEAAAAILSSMALVSIVGRVTGGFGDFVPPSRLLGIALILEGSGTGLFLIATTPGRAYAAVMLVGLGFGMAYISQAATLARFFGRRAFATTTGVRFFAGAFFAAFAPGLTGRLYDVTGSYTIPFLTLMTISLVGAAVAFVMPPPAPRTIRSSESP